MLLLVDDDCFGVRREGVLIEKYNLRRLLIIYSIVGAGVIPNLALDKVSLKLPLITPFIARQALHWIDSIF